MPRVLLMSGGMDTFIMSRLLEGEVDMRVFVDAESPWNSRDYYSLRSQAREFDWDIYEMRGQYLPYPDPDGHIPWRNLYFILLAAMKAGSEYSTALLIYLGALKGETSIDKSKAFMDKASALLSFTEGKHVEVTAPFSHLTKTELVAAYLRAGFPAEHLTEFTTSCYAPVVTPGKKGCGKCMACFHRWVALYNNGIEEEFDSPPWEATGQFVTGRYLMRAMSAGEIGSMLRNNVEAARALAKKGVAGR